MLDALKPFKKVGLDLIMALFQFDRFSLILLAVNFNPLTLLTNVPLKLAGSPWLPSGLSLGKVPVKF